MNQNKTLNYLIHMETPRDPQLWKMAKKRAAFKTHLLIYLLVNTGLWTLWAVGVYIRGESSYPWPIWSSLGWGIGLVSHYLSTYALNEKEMIEREYQKLLNKQ